MAKLIGLLSVAGLVALVFTIARGVRWAVLRRLGASQARVFGGEEPFEQPAYATPTVVFATPAAVYAAIVVLATSGGVGEATRAALDGRVVPKTDSPAQASGIHEGDRIVAIDEQATTDFADVIERIRGAAGRTVAIAVERGTARLKLEVPVPPSGKIGLAAAPVTVDVGLGEAFVAALGTPRKLLELVGLAGASANAAAPETVRGAALTTLAGLLNLGLLASPFLAIQMLPRRKAASGSRG